MTSGGRREGVGRPYGTGKFKVPTTPLRVPTHRLEDVKQFIAEENLIKTFSTEPFFELRNKA